MHAVVVYESMYGNTHLIADAIGAGLEAAFDVRVVPVFHAGPTFAELCVHPARLTTEISEFLNRVWADDEPRNRAEVS